YQHLQSDQSLQWLKMLVWIACIILLSYIFLHIVACETNKAIIFEKCVRFILNVSLQNGWLSFLSSSHHHVTVYCKELFLLSSISSSTVRNMSVTCGTADASRF